MPRKKRRLAQNSRQQRLPFSRLARSPRKKKRSGRGKVLAALAILLLLGIPLTAGYLKLHSYVIDLRVQRARKTAGQVLAQTSLPEEERGRYALAIARNSVEKELNPSVVAAIVVVESGGNPLAVAPSGDLGLMQVNVRIHSKIFNFQERNLLNPEQNIAVGTSILKSMVLWHGSDKAIAAYNRLLPEKRDYTSRVQAVLGKAGFSPQTEMVEMKRTVGEALSDWIEVLLSRQNRQGES